MAASVQSLKESKHRARTPRSPVSEVVVNQAELNLNRAFDALIRCELRTRAVSSELGNILQRSIDSAARMYHHAFHLHRIRQYQAAKKVAESICDFCDLLNNLAEEQTDNVLHLPLPPQMHLAPAKKPSRSRKLHPSLKMLDSYIRQRMTRISKFYRGRLSNYSAVLSQFSKYLEQVEKVH